MHVLFINFLISIKTKCFIDSMQFYATVGVLYKTGV